VFFLTMAVLSLLAGLLPVHNIAQYGRTTWRVDAVARHAGLVPDGVRILKSHPSWMSFDVLGVISSEFVGGLFLPSLVFVAVAVWLFIDRAEKPEHFTRNYLDRPFPTAVGIPASRSSWSPIAGMDDRRRDSRHVDGRAPAVPDRGARARPRRGRHAHLRDPRRLRGRFGAGGEEATTDDRPSSATEGSSDD